MVFEVVDKLGGRGARRLCDEIVVTIHTTTSSQSSTMGAAFRRYQDDDEMKRSAAEIVMTELHAGASSTPTPTRCPAASRRGRFGSKRAFGMAALTTWRDGQVHQMESATASRWPPLKATAPASGAAPRCTSLLREVFGTVDTTMTSSRRRLRELSFLNKRRQDRAHDQRAGKEENFAFSGVV